MAIRKLNRLVWTDLDTTILFFYSEATFSQKIHASTPIDLCDGKHMKKLSANSLNNVPNRLFAREATSEQFEKD